VTPITSIGAHGTVARVLAVVVAILALSGCVQPAALLLSGASTWSQASEPASDASEPAQAFTWIVPGVQGITGNAGYAPGIDPQHPLGTDPTHYPWALFSSKGDNQPTCDAIYHGYEDDHTWVIVKAHLTIAGIRFLSAPHTNGVDPLVSSVRVYAGNSLDTVASPTSNPDDPPSSAAIVSYDSPPLPQDSWNPATNTVQVMFRATTADYWRFWFEGNGSWTDPTHTDLYALTNTPGIVCRP
jgi:hypothetical protein